MDVGITVKINMPQVLSKVENDEFGMFLSNTWKRLITPYTPHRDGIMENSAQIRPFEIYYPSSYAHYMYNGIIYGPNFPIDADGNFVFLYDPTKVADWRSPRKETMKKYPTGRRFNYRKDHNRQATDHWDKAAEAAGQKEKLITAANKYLRRLG